MSYTVTWNRSAELQLAEIWFEANDRKDVSDAANELDKMLRFAPQSVGESRSADRRFVVVRPLTVVFRVRELDRMVRVLSVRRLPEEE
jgi:hypothetical protein